MGVKQKTDVHSLGATVSNRTAIITVNMLGCSITNIRGHIKINECVKTALYDWILQYPQVLKSQISNYCPKVYIDVHFKTQMAI